MVLFAAAVVDLAMGRFFKSPPFNEYQVINQPESLWHMGTYQRNASPTGPTAWLVAEVSYRNLRFIDSNFKALYANNITSSCNYMDQDCLMDLLPDVQTGNILFARPWTQCQQISSVQKAMNSKKFSLFQNLSGSRSFVKSTSTQLPEWMEAIAGIGPSEKMIVRDFVMRMPHIETGWETSLGGNMYGSEEKGPLALEMLKQLEDDCPGCPMWPDPENLKDLEAARSTPTENFLFAPPFLIFGYYPRGRLGFRHQQGRATRQVIGHPNRTQTKINPTSANTAVTGFWHQQGHATHQLNVSAPRYPSERERDEALPRLIALHPDVRLDKLLNLFQFVELLVGLAQVAIAAHRTMVAIVTHRTMVLPDLPCSLAWVSKNRLHMAKPEPLPLRDNFFPHFPIPEVRGEWMEAAPNNTMKFACTWFPLTFEPCFNHGYGMLQVEFEQLINWHNTRLGGSMTPQASNTLFAPEFLATIARRRGKYDPSTKLLSVDWTAPIVERPQ
eukprot:gene14413-20407_t